MKIGFIGCGNMATAMIKGILDSKKVAADAIIASAKSDRTREKIKNEACRKNGRPQVYLFL